MNQKLMLKPIEAAEALSIGRSRIYELISSGKLRSVTIGRSRLIPVKALEEFIETLQDTE